MSTDPSPAPHHRLVLVPAALLLATALAAPASAQPEIPTQAPPDAPWRVVMVSDDEPGEPLVVSGTVTGADGLPAAGASVFVYHTDAEGSYGPHGNRDPRLRAYARTDAEGRYEFHTIRPASYPGQRIAAHIHVHVAPPGGGPDQVGEIVFEGDPLVSDRMRVSDFFVVRPVTRDDDGVQRVTYDVRLKE